MESENSTGGKLGLESSIMLLIGAMLGSAIYSLSGLTLWVAGPSALLSWLLAGVIMLGYGICMSELAMRFPRSGGVYLFPRYAFGGSCGRMLGWLSCWSAILTNIMAIAFSAIYVEKFLCVSFPWGDYMEQYIISALPWINNLQTPLAIASILLCFGANAIRLEVTGCLNAVVVLVMLAILLIYIFCGFCNTNFSLAQFRPFFSQGTAGWTGFVSAIPMAIIGYSGIVALAFMASTVRHPGKTIPRAMTIAVAVVCGVYLLVIGATAGLVSMNYRTSAPGECFMLLFVACYNKITAVPWLSVAVGISAVLALLTTMMVCVSMNAWAIQAASEDGLLPARLGRLNACGMPATASAVTCAAAMGAACFPQMTRQIVNLGAVFNIITMLLTMAALVKSRHKDVECRAFPLWRKALPYVVLLVLLACDTVGVLAGGRKMWLYTAVFLAVGVLIALAAKKKNSAT